MPEIKQKLTSISENTFVLVSDMFQDDIAELALNKKNKIVAPTKEELKRIIFINNGRKSIKKIFIKCLSYRNLSPYHLNQNLSYQVNSLGIKSIIDEIIMNDNRNYFLAGATGSGKTSMLRELEKRYLNRYIVDCHYIDLKNQSNILKCISEEIGVNSKVTVENIINNLQVKNNRQVFIIDNTELFFEKEKDTHFKYMDILKKISSTKVIFIFSVSWVFYKNNILRKERNILGKSDEDFFG